MPRFKVTLPARSAAHTVRPAPPKERTEVPLDRRYGVSIGGFAELMSTSIPTVQVMIGEGMPVLRCGKAGGRIIVLPSVAIPWLEARVSALRPGTDADDGDARPTEPTDAARPPPDRSGAQRPRAMIEINDDGEEGRHVSL